MPNKYIKKNIKRYNPELLPVLAKMINDGTKSLYSIHKEYGIPTGTLHNWTNKRPSKIGSGGNPVMSMEEENIIVDAVEFLAQCGYPQCRNDIKNMVQSFICSIGRTTPFKDDRPGKDWMLLFEKRHAERLTKRKPEILTTSRAASLTKEVVDKFFDIYENLLDKHRLRDKPHCIFNLDETGLTVADKNEKVFVGKGVKDAYKKCPTGGKTTFSVLFCISASGIYLPPFTIYKSKYLYNTWVESGPKGAAYGCSESGWMMDLNFESWFSKVFVTHVSDMEKPVLLTFDGHNSHLTYNTVKTAMDNNIIILCIPPNTSHALQPLDVGVFRSVKEMWKDIMHNWYKESRMKNVDKNMFPKLLAKLWPRLDSTTAKTAFRGAGLYPPDRTKVNHRIVRTTSEATPTEPADDAPTPRKCLRQAIIQTISPEPSTSSTGSENVPKVRKRTRVQAKHGEVLTDYKVLQRMKLEAQDREEKKSKKQAKNLQGNTMAEESQSEIMPTIKKHKGMTKSKRSLNFYEESSDSSESVHSLSTSESDSEESQARGRSETKVALKAQDLVPETFVIVQYEGSYFPGQIKSVGKRSYNISCFCKCGPKAWKWPTPEDIHDYTLEDVISVIPAPSPCGNRGQWLIPQVERYWKAKTNH